MAVTNWSEVQEERVEPQFCEAKGKFIRGKEIEVGQITYPAGTDVKAHALPNEQIFTIMEGKAAMRVSGEEKTVSSGEAILVRPETEFSIRVLEKLEVLRFQDVGAGPAAKKEGGPAFFKWAEMKSDFITPSYSTGQGPVVSGERIEVAYMFYPAGGGGKPHSHPNEQIQVTLKGKSRSTIGGEARVRGPGDIVFMPSNTEHSGQTLEDMTVVNCKNIVPGWSVYHARWEK
jgi:quercetin dioxygenase-like cupin family protein